MPSTRVPADPSDRLLPEDCSGDPPAAAPSVTRDSLFHGKLLCRQHRHGYRFSLDSLLAARFCRPNHSGHALDLGAGCGIIGLILAHIWPQLRLTALEIQPSLARLARENVHDNGFSSRMRVIEADLRRIEITMSPDSCDLVVVNPPYRPLGSARIDRSNNERARARNELDAALGDFVHAAAWAVRRRGKVVLVLPAARTAACCVLLHTARLEPKRLRPIYGFPGDSRAKLVLIEAVKGGGPGLELLPPLYVFAAPGGEYTEEMHRWYQDGPLEESNMPPRKKQPAAEGEHLHHEDHHHACPSA